VFAPNNTIIITKGNTASMADLSALRTKENLDRAWLWIRSNPDAQYKSYFRNLYVHFAASEELLLNDLADRLRRNTYEPEPSCKIFHPKPSGILRPLSLLTVEDQIAYQAAVNIVAEKLSRKTRRKQHRNVFGHLYAGKNSTWFYKKWSDGYKAFNDASREAFVSGFVYSASFDLTACYDSLDHGVLRHFLNDIGIDNDFSRTLTFWLEKWTATERGIFHGHGIPQGPLSSGLLSEVVLRVFDQLDLKGIDFRYLRYVDDIRLFAKNERVLRRLLVSLDLISKDIGLFPQSSKIEIHKVHNIEDELKTVSNPPETSITRKFVDQEKLITRIKELSPRYKISDTTRFKFLLAHAHPSSKLTARLWHILEHQPELYRNFANYLRRYQKLPDGTASKVLKYIEANTLYDAVRAEFIGAVDGRMSVALDCRWGDFLLRSVWRSHKLSPDLKSACAKFLIRCGRLAPANIENACLGSLSWWARAQIIDSLEPSTLGARMIENIVAGGVKSESREVALSAAWKGFQASFVPAGTRSTWNRAGELLYLAVGSIQKTSSVQCGVTNVLNKYLCKRYRPKWKRFFGSRYAQAERQAIEAIAASSVNISSFINLLDVFNDLLIDALYRTDPTIGSYTLGGIGSVLNAPTGRFASKYPATFLFCGFVHSLRYESLASHPLIKRTGKPTKQISHKHLPKLSKLFTNAIDELLRSRII
jgi:hypothetical protein